MLEDKVVAITGASSGIGLEMAKLFAANGAHVVMLSRNEQKLAEASNQVVGSKEAVVLDVASFEEASRTAARIVDRHGKIDIWINNAGYGIFNRFAEAPMEQFEQMMDVNYLGTVRCTKAVLPYMLDAQNGHIINIASMAGKIGSAKSSAYSATKHAVIGFTNCLRQELAGTGVYLTLINPGPIDTPFFDQADPSGQYKKNVAWFMLRPEKVARIVLKAARTRQPEVNVPFTAAAGVKLFQLFPRLFDRVMSGMINLK
ncbi:SDR family NAD(P)-dependent oxidoreductase [Ferviditalea candida]|uniref:SDR family NAD(P)-dependent oxidoreductase n=1 Tax=Ferviditalea candida TaxID=3108399 RepID=A0ABU5ZD76_9BACL|nr:SDR family NAD(P)-dependent oxidoreductase [Paenibacillaceae bacterium T2]